jgi:hypothetical protein
VGGKGTVFSRYSSKPEKTPFRSSVSLKSSLMMVAAFV